MNILKSFQESATGLGMGFGYVISKLIQKSIGESVAGWRYGFAHVAGKAAEAVGGAQKGIEKSLAGWGMGISHVAGKTSEAFGNIGGGLSSFKYPLYALVAVFLFIAVMVSIGYSGVGAPVARVAEKEYVRRR
jgi:amino acid transporter